MERELWMMREKMQQGIFKKGRGSRRKRKVRGGMRLTE